VRRDLQIVFQDPYASLNPRMTVGDIVAEPLVVHDVGDRKSRRRSVEQLLEVVGRPDSRPADRHRDLLSVAEGPAG
jgi:ABC-type microcin C transport system duplicated ATPase subunit YejF